MMEKILALTFDDGVFADTTLPLLDLLAQNGIPASFFVVGENLTEETAGILRKAVSLGCEIQNHSFHHLDMTQLTAAEIEAEVAETSLRVQAITGITPTYFRPPYIAVNERMLETISLPMVAGFGAEDYNPAVSAEERVRRILAQVRDGAIILLHDAEGNAQTVTAVETLIPLLLGQGYTFVTISQLFALRGITPQKGIIYSYVQQTEMYAET